MLMGNAKGQWPDELKRNDLSCPPGKQSVLLAGKQAAFVVLLPVKALVL